MDPACLASVVVLLAGKNAHVQYPVVHTENIKYESYVVIVQTGARFYICFVETAAIVEKVNVT